MQHLPQTNKKEKAILVGVVLPGLRRHQALEHLDELALLADTAGAVVVGREIQEIKAPHPATLIGKGKVAAVARLAEELEADVVLFDEDLTPVQAKNLEKEIKKRVVDRSGLILDIFARRARTAEAQAQVALAQLQYLLPRLTRQWSHLERQEGAIGTRGPGETQLETDRRLIHKRIGLLKDELEKIRLQRDVRRRRRDALQKAALVGYTNAGKSSLLNALAGSGVHVEDRLFATLDATVRTLALSRNDKVLLIDTVGFIRKLPAHLVASFRSTLEEAAEADVLLHVIDASHPNLDDHVGTVQQVLDDLGLADRPVIPVFNKIDLLEDGGFVDTLARRFPGAVFVSALRGIGLERLRRAIAERFEAEREILEVRIPFTRPERLAAVHGMAEILEKRYEEDAAVLVLRASGPNAERIREMLSGEE
ncbi:MAG: GTPase HflX [bacterium]|nr:GTPase HflX [bacterium]